MTIKADLRDLAMFERDEFPQDRRPGASAAITEACTALIATMRPRSVAGYIPIRSEYDPRSVMEKARAGGAVIALPAIVNGRTLVFRRYDLGHDLVPGGFGTFVPMSDAPEIAPALIVVPLVGFDRAGTRLGYGKGHYDRALAALHARDIHPFLVGVAFSVQEVARIPAEPHDVRLDCVVTEKETMFFRRKAS